MEYSFIKVQFTLFTLLIVLFGGLMNNFEHNLPVVIRQVYRFGKFCYKGEPCEFVEKLNIRKSYFFKHLYMTGSVWSTGALLLATHIYFFNGENLHIIRVLLDTVAGYDRKTSVSAVSAWLALALLNVQLYRRLYETTYVSVFSNTFLNAAFFAIGDLHYFGTVCAIIVEAPGFTQLSFEHKTAFVLSDVKWSDIAGTLLFIWASYRQYNCAVVLANLRKNKQGVVEHYKHMIPRGDLFEYVSSPHMLCEIILYLSLNIILWGHTTWPYVFIWVLSNQVEVALLSHWWCLSEFKDYPKNRYALIPYVL